jgi:hypothetical protein
MKIKTFVLLAFLIGLTTIASAQSSEIKLLKEKKVISGKEGVDYWIYQYSKLVSNIDTIWLWDGYVNSPYKESVLLLIDDHPFANWTHPCRYIFVDKSKKMYKIIPETSPPINFDEFSLMTKIDLPNGYKYDFSKYNKESLPKSKMKSAISSGDASYGYKYAVIISGGYNKSINHERYWNDCSAIYSTLRNIYGFERHQIFVLMSDGNDPEADMRLIDGSYVDSPKDLDGDGIGDIHNMATKPAVISLFSMLGEWMLPNDYLFVFTTDHGTLKNGTTYLCLWNEQLMSAAEFATELNKINAGKISIVMEQCHSGGFINHLTGNGRVIATACLESESSYATTDLLYNEFVYHWTAAALGEYPDGTLANADANSDGFITMLEAFEFARDNNTRLETPQYNSLPQTLGQELTNFGFEVNSSLQNITINSGNEQKHYAYNISVAGFGTSYNVKNGGNSYLKAGNSIVLNPGFKAELGSELHAFIEPFSIPVLRSTDLLKSVKVESISFQVDSIKTSINKELFEDLLIYPNPSTGLFYFINRHDVPINVSVYNSNGILLIHDIIYSSKWVIDLSSQPAGFYFLQFFTNNKTITKKLTKQ